MIESVVAVFVYEKEIFYFQRQLNLRAFPGGKIDRDESETPLRTRYLKDYPPRIMHALCRELDEELNFGLEDAINNDEIKHFEYMGLAKPPVDAMGKFIAHHFKITLNKKIQFVPGPEEAHDSGWIPVNELWELYSRGNILAVIPTLRIIEELAKDISTVKIEPFNALCNREKEVPVLELIRGIHFLFIASGRENGHPYSNAVVFGDPAYLIDPSPCPPEEFEKLVFSLKPFRLQGLVITHYPGNLHVDINLLARKLNLEIRCSSVTHDLILKEIGSSCFNGIDVKDLREKEILTYWLGHRVAVYKLPGDAGRIGLAPENLSWFHVGDLIRSSDWRINMSQNLSNPGDKKRYRESINRILEMDPSIIIPSHGMPLGSTCHLKKIYNTLSE